LWFLVCVGVGILVGWIASRSDAFTSRAASWVVAGFVLLSGLVVLVPVVLHILGRRYRLTSQRLFIEVGILSKTIDQTELIRVDDVRVHKTLFDRIFNLGTITLLSTDVSNREVIIEGVAGPDAVAEAVRNHMRAQRGKALFVENL
jgi:membrane protein YdbS with pleckstrin-like domain